MYLACFAVTFPVQDQRFLKIWTHHRTNRIELTAASLRVCVGVLFLPRRVTRGVLVPFPAHRPNVSKNQRASCDRAEIGLGRHQSRATSRGNSSSGPAWLPFGVGLLWQRAWASVGSFIFSTLSLFVCLYIAWQTIAIPTQTQIFDCGPAASRRPIIMHSYRNEMKTPRRFGTLISQARRSLRS